MLVIGLTGGIGSGKTTVSDMFAKHSVPVIDADIIAREVTQPNKPAYKEIISHFGQDIVLKDKTLDRPALRKKIFEDPSERIWIENLLHPIILEEIDKSIHELQTPYCIIVIPLLFETSTQSLIHHTLLVDATEATQIKRVTARDKLTAKQVQEIMATQVSREERLENADEVLLNEGTEEELEQEVNKLHQKYLKSSS